MPQLSEKIKDRGFYKLGKHFFDKCDLIHAREYFEKALKQFKEEENAEGALNVYGFLVRIHRERLEQDAVAKTIAEASEYLKTCPPRVKKSFYFYQLGVTLFHQEEQADSENDRSTEAFIKSYHESLKEGDMELTAKALYAVAASNAKRDRTEDALYYLEKLHELLRDKVKKPYLLGTMFILYGQIYRKKKEFDVSLDNYFRAHRALQDKKCWNLYNYVLYGIGKTYKEMGEMERALIYIELAINSNDPENFKYLHRQLEGIHAEIRESDADICIDFQKKEVHEKQLGRIDFKNRFILLEILHLLSKNPGKEFSKEDLAEQIWGADYNPMIQDKLIYTNVSRLRKLIEPDASKPRYVVKSRNGYFFNDSAAVQFQNDYKNQGMEREGESPLNLPLG